MDDESSGARLALAIAAIGATEPDTVTTTIEAPADDGDDDAGHEPVETVAPEPARVRERHAVGLDRARRRALLAAAIAGVVYWRRKRRAAPPS